MSVEVTSPGSSIFRRPGRMAEEPKSASFTLGQFGNELQGLISKVVEGRVVELDQREALVKQREDKCEQIFKNIITKGLTDKTSFCSRTVGRITLNVGSVIYETTRETLLRVEDSYFRGLLNSQFKKDDEESHIFIDRDGDVFKYVLEYLRYGTVHSLLDPGMKAKLLSEADFYLLPGLTEFLKKNGPDVQTLGVWMCAGSSAVMIPSRQIDWNTPQYVPKDSFTIGAGVITFHNDGLYLILLRYQPVCGTHGQGNSSAYLSEICRICQS